MLDHNMQQAYLDSFRYDDSLLPLDGDETAFTPRMGDKLLLNWFVIVCSRLVSFILTPRPAQPSLINCMGRGHVVQ